MSASMASTELEAISTWSWGEVGVRGGVSALASVAPDEVRVPAEDISEERKPEASEGLGGGRAELGANVDADEEVLGGAEVEGNEGVLVGRRRDVSCDDGPACGMCDVRSVGAGSSDSAAGDGGRGVEMAVGDGDPASETMTISSGSLIFGAPSFSRSLSLSRRRGFRDATRGSRWAWTTRQSRRPPVCREGADLRSGMVGNSMVTCCSVSRSRSARLGYLSK